MVRNSEVGKGKLFKEGIRKRGKKNPKAGSNQSKKMTGRQKSRNILVTNEQELASFNILQGQRSETSVWMSGGGQVMRAGEITGKYCEAGSSRRFETTGEQSQV